MRPLRLMVLIQGVTPEDQIGYHRAFERMVAMGSLESYHPVPYGSNRSAEDWVYFFQRVLSEVRRNQIDAVLFQFFHLDLPVDPRPFITELKGLQRCPVVAVSCGDPFDRWCRPPSSLLRTSSVADLTFSTSMGDLSSMLIRSGAKRVVLMPHGACTTRFGSDTYAAKNDTKDFDVVMIANRYTACNPLRSRLWLGRRRTASAVALERRFGHRFGLFGKGWVGHRSWQGEIPYAKQIDTFKRAYVSVGGFPGSLCDYYHSDRLMIAALSGTPMVEWRTRGIDELLLNQSECLFVDRTSEMLEGVEMLLSNSEYARTIGAQGQLAVVGRHLDEHRTALMVECLRALRSVGRSSVNATCPELPYFHRHVDRQASRRTAILGW